MHKSQVFFYFLLAFIIGIFAGSFFNINQYVTIGIFLVSILIIALFFRRDSKILNPKVALLGLLAIAFVVGVLRFNAINSKKHTLSEIARASAEVKPDNKHKIKISLFGYINAEPQVKDDTQKFVLYVKYLDFSPYKVNTEEQILVTTRAYPKYSYGQQLKVNGEIKVPENFNNFDYKAYLSKDDIFTTTNYPEISETNVSLSFYEKVKIKFFTPIFKIKNIFERSLSRSIAEPNAAFVKGLLLGSSSGLSSDIKDAFSRTSTTHILAVSGYNITIIATVISWFFLLFLRRPIAFWFSAAGIIIFTILTGAGASVVRAAIMGLLVLVAQRTSRLSDPKNALLLAAAAMVFLNPHILRYDIGFQLSFGATLGLLYVSPVIEKYFSKLPEAFGIRETLIMTMSAQVFVLPLLIYYFKSISLVSLPANLLVLPTIPLAMLLGFFTGIGGLIIPFLGQLIGYFLWLVTSFELGIIRLLAKPSWATVSIGFSWPVVIIVYVIIISFLVYLRRLEQERRPS